MDYGYLFEIYPDEIQARLEAYDRFATNVPANPNGPQLEFVIETLARWNAGQNVTVAFNGGTAELHKKIADTASEWLNFGNLSFDFGLNNGIRTWSFTDTAFAADIRISFDQPGYWSLVGTQSSNSAIIRPGQASMNFSGFTDSLPTDWQATVLHEFGHALGFHHEHQHPVGGCELSFRWEDDPGYRPSVDNFGQFVPDSSNLRPGIYTVLGGPPNRWPKSKVDHNLRQLRDSHAYTVGPFDHLSIMKYFFGDWMFREGTNSHCFSQRNRGLSEQDKAGMQTAYPSGQDRVEELRTRKRNVITQIVKEGGFQGEARKNLEVQLESLQE